MAPMFYVPVVLDFLEMEVIGKRESEQFGGINNLKKTRLKNTDVMMQRGLNVERSRSRREPGEKKEEMTG